MSGLTYFELMTTDLDQFTKCGNQLAAVLSSVAAAEHAFGLTVVRPLSGMTDWNGDAASHALTTAQAHQHALTTTRQEFAAAARALELYASDLAGLQQAMVQAVNDATSNGVVIHPDGTTDLAAAFEIASQGPQEPMWDEIRHADEKFNKMRESILNELSELDAGCSRILGEICGDAPQLYIDSTNDLPSVDFNRVLSGLAEINMDLGLDDDAGTNKSIMDRLLNGTSKLSALTDLTIDGGSILNTTVANVAKALGKSPDADVRSSTLKIMEILNKGSAFTKSDIAELISKKGLLVVDTLVSAAEYSRDSKSVVEVAEKTDIKVTATLGGMAAGRALALPICGVLNADDGEIGLPVCDTVLGTVFSWFGGKAGDLVGEKINEAAFDATEGTLDPFAVQYRTAH